MRTAFFRFLPTIPVYLVFHLIFLPTAPGTMLLALYFLGMMILFGMGLAAFFSTLQIYFRDTSSFLPFFVRLWMYLSPVLWLPERLRARLPRWMLTLIQLNPLYSMLGGYADAIQEGGPAAVHVGHLRRLGGRRRRPRLPVLHLEGA